jgi:neutral amino acid transport system permease protein
VPGVRPAPEVAQPSGCTPARPRSPRRPLRARLAAWFAALLGALVLVPLLATAASAAGEDVHGTLRAEREGVRGPVAGVTVTVARQTGEPVGTATTDAEGAWAVELPTGGPYVVTLDAATLPEGVDLRDPSRSAVSVDLAEGEQRLLLFPLGEGRAAVNSTLDRVVQLVAEGLRYGLILGLAALGLSLIYGTTGLVNFSHGELVTLGALVTYGLNAGLGLHLLAAAALGMAICGGAGYLQDAVFWGRLRRRGLSLNSLMIVSIGVALLVRYFYLYLVGPEAKAYTDFRSQPAVDLGAFPVRLAPRDYWSMGIAAVVIAVTVFALTRSRLGKATRAVADNPALAAASGIDVERVIRLVWTVGAALAALAGVLLGVAQQSTYNMGSGILLLLFAAVTLGGLGTASGALVGSLVVGVLIQLSTLVIATEVKHVGALAVLILILLVRPQGILGRAQRVG